MRATLTFIVMALGCKDPIDHYGVNPGGNGPPVGGEGSEGPDAPVAGDGAMQVAGRVCLVSDLRILNVCSDTLAGGLTVTLGSSTATTLVNGAFAITLPLGSAPVWRVSGAAVVTSVVPFSASTLLPAIAADTYTDLLVSNGVLIQDQQGSVVASLVRQATVLTDARVAVAPTTPNPTFYDGTSAALWDQDATGPKGIAWIPGADVMQPAQLTVTPPLEAPAPPANVVVENQAITFVTLDVP